MKNRYHILLISLFVGVLPLQALRLSIAQTLFIGNKGVSLSLLQKRFKDKKPAIFVDFHGVVALKNTSGGIKTFKEKNLSSVKLK